MTSETQTQARNEPAERCAECTEQGWTPCYHHDRKPGAARRKFDRFLDDLNLPAHIGMLTTGALLSHVDAIEAEARDAALREQTRITPIDVERLAESMAAAGFDAHPVDTVSFARDVIAEYARLAALPHASTPEAEGEK